MRGFGFILSLIIIIGSLFLASGFWTYYPGHEYWQTSRAGLTSGFIHGAIAPIMIIAGIFTDYRVYEPNNIGWFYDFIYIIGIMIAWGGAGGSRHIIKNYYNSDEKLGKEDLKKIDKIVEQKIENSKSKRKKKKEEVSEKGIFGRLIKKFRRS